MPSALPIISGVSDLVGLVGGISQQNAENQAITQTGDQLQTGVQNLDNLGSSLVGNYTANAMPAENAMIASEPGQISSLQGGAEGLYGELAGTPYPGMIQSEGGQYMTYPNKAIGQEEKNARALSNWQGIKPQELGEATTVASNAAESAAQTMKAQMGGVANPGAVMENLGNQASTAGLQAALGLGSQAEQQELGAREAAGQEYGTVAGQQLQQVGGQVGATEGAGSLYDSALEGAAGGLTSISSQDIQQLLDALGLESSAMQTGVSAQETGTSDLLSMLGDEFNAMGQQQQQQGNPFGDFGRNLMDLFPISGGGQYGGTPSYSSAPDNAGFGASMAALLGF